MNQIIQDVQTWGDAKRKLAELGINWTIAQNQILGSHDPYTGRDRTAKGVHIYVFNVDGLEVAYYTPIMESMFVHDTPRIWGDQHVMDDYDYNEAPEDLNKCDNCKIKDGADICIIGGC